MKNIRTCFVKENGVFIEISKESLFVNRQRNPAFKGRFFVPIDRYYMEVSLDEYKRFYKVARRTKYIREEAVLHEEVSYHSLDNEDRTGEEIIADKDFEGVETLAVRMIMIENLKTVLKELNDVEYELIKAIYYNGITESEYAKIIGLSQKGVNKRKHKILKKLKKLLE